MLTQYLCILQQIFFNPTELYFEENLSNFFVEEFFIAFYNENVTNKKWLWFVVQIKYLTTCLHPESNLSNFLI